MAGNDPTCPFCLVEEPIVSNELAYVRNDGFPVSRGHLLIIPYRHVGSFFELTAEEHAAVRDLLIDAKNLLERANRPDGYNVGVNIGEAAGQTIAHVHVHLIPRYKGDVAKPRGGVRGVIPGKQDY